jgi:tRNA U38,U39,U40 pseudouridine synthase TruA
VRTVESDVVAALGGRSCVAAGRTDKDVSAISQVCCRATYSSCTEYVDLF